MVARAESIVSANRGGRRLFPFLHNQEAKNDACWGHFSVSPGPHPKHPESIFLLQLKLPKISSWSCPQVRFLGVSKSCLVEFREMAHLVKELVI